VTDHGCFGCGEENPIGLKLAFYRDGNRVKATVTPRQEYEGYLSLTHRGIAVTMLDEAMSWAVISGGGRLPVTTRLEIQYRKAMPVGVPVDVFEEVVRDRVRVIEARAEIRDQEGALIAAATGSFVRVSPGRQYAWEALYLQSGQS
jgi:acyl-coenzyme A thioesterase PaaI-like protein